VTAVTSLFLLNDENKLESSHQVEAGPDRRFLKHFATKLELVIVV